MHSHAKRGNEKRLLVPRLRGDDGLEKDRES